MLNSWKKNHVILSLAGWFIENVSVFLMTTGSNNNDFTFGVTVVWLRHHSHWQLAKKTYKSIYSHCPLPSLTEWLLPEKLKMKFCVRKFASFRQWECANIGTGNCSLFFRLVFKKEIHFFFVFTLVM